MSVSGRALAELDEKYIERMEDVLALYEKPYDAADPVVCLDEKPILLHKEVRPPRPAAPGHTAKRDNEYQRCGTANVFAVVEPKGGRHFTCATPNRTAADAWSCLSPHWPVCLFMISLQLLGSAR